jgi:hypothetical protein
MLILGTVTAQDDNDIRNKSNGFSVGFKLNQAKQDFGMGLDLTSPYFLYNKVAVRGQVLFQFHEYFNVTQSESVWAPYVVSRLGLVGVGGRPLPFLRLYGEGGGVVGFPASDVSSSSEFVGAYGHFGFEFFMSNSEREFVSYYIELGAVGTGAVADKLASKPIYHNGFNIGVGFRFYL